MTRPGEASNPEMFFFPYVGGGHFLPMVDLARLFASHHANSTIVAPPSAAPLLRKSLLRDQNSGLHVTLHVLHLPPDHHAPLDASDMSSAPFTDTSALRDPLRRLLSDLRPDCLVADMFHHWVSDLADEVGIPRIVFGGNGCFARCAEESIRLHAPHEAVSSDSEPFVLPGLPDRIKLTRTQLPSFVRTKPNHKFGDRMAKNIKSSFGVLVNSFFELEPAYADYFKREMVRKAWIVGPVCLCNRNLEDKVERGRASPSIEIKKCMAWLDSKNPNSVLFISFGSLARLPRNQILEIAHGLEASNCPFVWALGKVLDKEGVKGGGEEEDLLFPEGFEIGVSESGRGLVIRGWAPQLLILEHPAVGGFLTHCGWNSTTEAVTAGVPMVTWPLSAEQFHNEKLVTEVLRVGVGVGSVEWASWDAERSVTVGREKVAEAVGTVMGGGEKGAEMRRKARELAEKAKKAVEEGGSSYADAEALIDELKIRRRMDVVA